MHTVEDLMAKATGNDTADRRAIVNLLRCYGMSTNEVIRLVPGKERVDKILQLQEEKGYIPFVRAPPVPAPSVQLPTVNQELAGAKRAATAILRILASSQTPKKKRSRIRRIAIRLEETFY
jgi:hypothetical protein